VISKKLLNDQKSDNSLKKNKLIAKKGDFECDDDQKKISMVNTKEQDLYQTAKNFNR
jgi:hypothetical protein